jgi:hypothetical protein
MKRVAILLSLLMMVAPRSALAQSGAASTQGEGKDRQSITAGQTSDGQPPKLSLKIEEGQKVVLRNRFGPIVVTGVGGDTMDATATVIKQGTGAFKIHLVASRPTQDRVMIATAVASSATPQGKGEAKVVARSSVSTSTNIQTNIQTKTQTNTQTTTKPVKPAKPSPKPKPAPKQTVQPAPPPPPPASAQGQSVPRVRPARPVPPRPAPPPPLDSLRGVGEIRLEVKLPRNARVELIDSRRYAIVASGNPTYLTNTRNDVVVTNVGTPVSVVSSGDVQATNIAGIEVRTRAGNVIVKEVDGPVSIVTVTGSVLVRDAGGDARVVSISGPISIECAKGRIEASTTNGTITLSGIGGDVEATTTGGTITFTGAIRDNGRYRLRSMMGHVRMLIQKDPPGFQASVSSYKGLISVEFPLKLELSANPATPDLAATEGQPVRRMVGRYGDADARITLDSFSGTVQLGRAPADGPKKCR